MPRTMVKWTLILIGVITLLVVAALAVPLQLWRTAETPQTDLQYSPPARATVFGQRHESETPTRAKPWVKIPHGPRMAWCRQLAPPRSADLNCAGHTLAT